MTQPTTPNPKPPPKPAKPASSNAILAALIGFIALTGLGLIVWIQNHPTAELAQSENERPVKPEAANKEPESAPVKEPVITEPVGPKKEASNAGRAVATVETASAAVEIRPPVPVKTVTPPYPPLAKAAKVRGEVSVALKVNEKGVPVKATVLEGPTLLRASALEAAKDWRFRPALSGSEPVPSTFIARFHYKI